MTVKEFESFLKQVKKIDSTERIAVASALLAERSYEIGLSEIGDAMEAFSCQLIQHAKKLGLCADVPEAKPVKGGKKTKKTGKTK